MDNTRTDGLCPWNDHGYTCGRVGCISDSTNGTGPFYCPEHWWKLRGQIVTEAPRKSPAQIDAEFLVEAKNYCYDHKLDSVDKMRVFVRKASREVGKEQRFGKEHWHKWAVWTMKRRDANMVAYERAEEMLRTMPAREPGQDDAEIAA